MAVPVTLSLMEILETFISQFFAEVLFLFY